VAVLTKLNEYNINITDDFIMTDTSLGFEERYIWSWPKTGFDGWASGDAFSENAAGDPIFSLQRMQGDRTIEFTVSGRDPATGDLVATTKIILHVTGMDGMPPERYLSGTTTTFAGTAGVDIVHGPGGIDKLAGGADNDYLYGNRGDDNLDGGSGIDKLYGGSDNDTLHGRSSGDWLYGEKGNDFIYGDSGSDWMDGGAGNDHMDGGTGADWLLGGDGNDTMSGSSNNDTLIGGAGGDTLIGGTGTDKARYTDSDEGVVANLADASQNTNDAAGDSYNSIENLTGTAYADKLTGNGGANRLSGSFGNDTLDGGGGNDELVGGAGKDKLIGGSGTDKTSYLGSSKGVAANLGDASQNTNNAKGDTYSSIENLTGTIHDDSLTGNDGANRLSGSWGNDTLDGGLGVDKLVGGLGEDTFVFSTALGSSNIDKIDDFDLANDRIALDANIFAALGGVGVLSSSLFIIDGVPGSDSGEILYETSTGKLYYDADGRDSGDGVLFARLAENLALTASHFEII